MVFGMDNSTDPPFKDITFREVQSEYGPINKLTSQEAYNVLVDILMAEHWLDADETESVKKALATQAEILNNYEKLSFLDLEDLYAP